MKKLTVITSAFILVFCTVASRGANLDRISAATGVSAQTLQAERASTGLGWGGIEKAHLLANARHKRGTVTNYIFADGHAASVETSTLPASFADADLDARPYPKYKLRQR